MGWAEPHSRGPGTTKEVEEAHVALDDLGVKPSGSLGERVMVVVDLVDRLHKKMENNHD